LDQERKQRFLTRVNYKNLKRIDPFRDFIVSHAQRSSVSLITIGPQNSIVDRYFNSWMLSISGMTFECHSQFTADDCEATVGESPTKEERDAASSGFQ
jgi:hypothetical protein